MILSPFLSAPFPPESIMKFNAYSAVIGAILGYNPTASQGNIKSH